MKRPKANQKMSKLSEQVIRSRQAKGLKMKQVKQESIDSQEKNPKWKYGSEEKQQSKVLRSFGWMNIGDTDISMIQKTSVSRFTAAEIK